MKNILLSILFALLLLPFSSQPVSAAPVIDYQLPYPGILPDNPLYILKAFRDKVTGFFISSPLKKAGFDIATADSRMSAGLALVEQKKSLGLAESTISKGLNYFEEALNKTGEAKKQGMDTTEIIKKMRLANLKHQEVIKDIQAKLNNKDKKIFDFVYKRAGDISQKIEKIN